MQPAPESQQFHIRRENARRQQREALRRQWLQRVRLAVEQIAPLHPAIRAVYLFGSLLQPGRFAPHSDLDVAVVCDDLAAESRFWQALEAELEANVDLRPCKGAIAWAVSAFGECVYEREIPPAGT